MPRGPKGEKRPADVIGNAVHFMRIATGEIEYNRYADGRRRRDLDLQPESAGWRQAAPD
jgi:hypothetical protein